MGLANKPSESGRLAALSDPSCSSYNNIKLLGRQNSLVTQRHLDQLHQLFVSHEAHHDFGISLLHRHHDLSQGCAMVHSRGAQNTDICQMELIGPRKIYPCAFYMGHKRQFVPYEYAADSTPLPNTPLLMNLANFLIANELQDILAVSRVRPKEHPIEETMMANGQGTIFNTLATEIDVTNPSTIVTEWAFIILEDGTPQVRAMKKCVQTQAGGHKVE